jgi:hypothetical protein
MLKRMAGRRERRVYLAVIAVQTLCLLAVMGQHHEQIQRTNRQMAIRADEDARLCDELQKTMNERDLNATMLRDAEVRLKVYEARHPELRDDSLAALGVAPEYR